MPCRRCVLAGKKKEGCLLCDAVMQLQIMWTRVLIARWYERSPWAALEERLSAMNPDDNPAIKALMQQALDLFKGQTTAPKPSA